MTETLKPKLNFEPKEEGGLFSFSYKPKSQEEEVEIKLLVEYPSVKPSPNGRSKPTVKRAKADFTSYKHKGSKVFHLEASDAVLQVLKNAQRFQKDQEPAGFWQAWAECMGDAPITPFKNPDIIERDVESYVELQMKYIPAGDTYDKRVTVKVYKPRIEWREITHNVFFSESELASPFFDAKALPTHNEPVLHRAYVDFGGYCCFDPEATPTMLALFSRARELQSEWESEVFWQSWDKIREKWDAGQKERAEADKAFHKKWQEEVGEKQKRFELYLELKKEFGHVNTNRAVNSHPSSPPRYL